METSETRLSTIANKDLIGTGITGVEEKCAVGNETNAPLKDTPELANETSDTSAVPTDANFRFQGCDRDDIITLKSPLCRIADRSNRRGLLYAEWVPR